MVKLTKTYKGEKTYFKYRGFDIFIKVIGGDLPEAIEGYVYDDGHFQFSTNITPIDIRLKKWNGVRWTDFDRAKFNTEVRELVLEIKKLMKARGFHIVR